MKQKKIIIISLVVVVVLVVVGISIGVGVYFFNKNKKNGRGIKKSDLLCLFDAAKGSSLSSDGKTITDLSGSGQNASVDKGTITLNSDNGGYFTIPAGSNVQFKTSKLPIGKDSCTMLVWVRVSSFPPSGSSNTCALYGATSTSGARSIYFENDGSVVIGTAAPGLNFTTGIPKVKAGVWTLLGYSFYPDNTFTAYTYDLSSKEINLTIFKSASSGFTTPEGSTGFIAFTSDGKSVEMDIALFAIYSSIFTKNDFARFIEDSSI